MSEKKKKILIEAPPKQSRGATSTNEVESGEKCCAALAEGDMGGGTRFSLD